MDEFRVRIVPLPPGNDGPLDEPLEFFKKRIELSRHLLFTSRRRPESAIYVIVEEIGRGGKRNGSLLHLRDDGLEPTPAILKNKKGERILKLTSISGPGMMFGPGK